MTLRITQYGESILHQDGKVVSSFGAELTELANQMLEAMDQAEGIGLAAQQIGEAIRFCVVAVSYTHLTLPRSYACRSRWSPYH